MSNVIVVIDGEFMRHRVFELKAFYFDGPGIRAHCLKHVLPDERLLRMLFYDSAPFAGKGEHPLSGPVDFGASAASSAKFSMHESLRSTPQMALRLGRLAWQQNAWQIKPALVLPLLRGEKVPADLAATDVTPMLRQKAVDMRIGLDIATIAIKHQAERLVLIANDADFVPAVKLARKEGLTVCLDPLRSKAADDLREHVDYVRNVLPIPEKLRRGVHTYTDPKEFDPQAT